MTAAQFRRIALGLDGAVERAHMGHPDFRAGGKIFATLHADLKHAMVKLTPAQQQISMREAPDIFCPEAGAWGRAGCTKVTLRNADAEAVGEALTLAWRAVTARPSAPPRSPAAARRGRKT